MFRECLNEYGWLKKFENEKLTSKIDKKDQDLESQKPFCMGNNAEHAPDICNEFITVFMEHKLNLWNTLREC